MIAVGVCACNTLEKPSNLTDSTTNPHGDMQTTTPLAETLTFRRLDDSAEYYTVELKLVKNSDGFTATLRRVYADQDLGHTVDNTEILASKLDCGKVIYAIIICLRDDRDADSESLTLNVKASGPKYEANMVRRYYDNGKGQDVIFEKILANDLELVPTTDIPSWRVSQQVRFGKDNRFAQGDLTEILLTMRADKEYSATLIITKCRSRFGGPNRASRSSA